MRRIVRCVSIDGSEEVNDRHSSEMDMGVDPTISEPIATTASRPVSAVSVRIVFRGVSGDRFIGWNVRELEPVQEADLVLRFMVFNAETQRSRRTAELDLSSATLCVLGVSALDNRTS